jgi:hypothetical protein
MMETQKQQHDTDYPPTDPALDALLDEALSTGTPPADPDLAERIYRETLPMLGRRPVLARIGPTLLRVAAAVAIITGGLIAVTLMNQPPPTQQKFADAPDAPVAPVAPVTPDDMVETLAPELAAIDSAIEPGNTLIDEQLDVLALRVDLASTEDAWGPDDLSTNDRIDQAVAYFEINRFSDDMTLLLTDGPELF